MVLRGFFFVEMTKSTIFVSIISVVQLPKLYQCSIQVSVVFIKYHRPSSSLVQSGALSVALMQQHAVHNYFKSYYPQGVCWPATSFRYWKKSGIIQRFFFFANFASLKFAIKWLKVLPHSKSFPMVPLQKTLAALLVTQEEELDKNVHLFLCADWLVAYPGSGPDLKGWFLELVDP